MTPEEHRAEVERVLGPGNWVECWHNFFGHPVPEGTPDASRVWHHKDFHGDPKDKA